MQLQENLSQFDDADIAVFAISNDPVDMQASFARDYGVSYPLLADVGSKVIMATGILNTLIEPHEEVYGIAFPGSYVIGMDGVIEEKRFFENYRNRQSAASVLRGGFGIDFEVRDNPHVDVAGDGVAIEATLGGEGMVFEEETTLFIDIALDDGLHLYGQPIPDGYIATEVTVEGPEDVEVGEVRYPATRPFRVDGLPEEFHVFADSRISMDVPIRNQSREIDPFRLRINVRYQACSDSACFLPQKRVLELDVPRLPLNRPASSD